MKEMYEGEHLTRAKTVADCIAKSLEAKKPKIRYLVGFGAKPLAFIQKFFGDRIYDCIIKKNFKM